MHIKRIGKISRRDISILVERMFASNELQNTADKYKLTKVPIAESGYSFGLCQHDCEKRKDARQFIKYLLKKETLYHITSLCGSVQISVSVF